MNIIIIGGSGFVSGTMARAACEAGHAVWAVTTGKRPLPEGVTGLKADRHDAVAFANVVARTGIQWDLVVDCICYNPEDIRQDLTVFKGRARHLVFVSSDFVFNPDYRTFPQKEDNPHFEEVLPYGKNKRLCELELLNSDSGGMAWTVVRPCHIYGPGSLLGCLPLHGRDPKLIPAMRAGEPLKLVGGGHFLQQPIFASDLAKLILSCVGNHQTYGQIYLTAGPDIIESREYYRIIADVLKVDLKVEEVPVHEHLEKFRPFLCHRIYNLKKIEEHGLKVPSTPIGDGLREHVLSWLEAGIGKDAN